MLADKLGFMKKILLIIVWALLFTVSFAQEYMQITAIESVIPGGFGRSRLIATQPDGQIEELPLENFFSMVGINFGNIRMNDRIITNKLNEYAKQGWSLVSVTSGVYSGSENRAAGIFITRYVLKR
ncbi:MAG: hypothetical protein KatS3mg035_0056 [Bacteroidia bacterium]|nr:MAG: hypothetical protein KatS3mg035_0056 [Bacteroidia bacterium]